jgi:hypothetical protein
VAITKCDTEGANPAKVKNELSMMGLPIEDVGKILTQTNSRLDAVTSPKHTVFICSCICALTLASVSVSVSMS